MRDALENRGPMEVLSGTAHPGLAMEIAEHLRLTPDPLTVTRFPDSEIHVSIDTSVRGKDVFVIQPTCPPVNENLIELMVILDALVRASAGRITAVIPYYGYARQDKKTAGREPITARMVADMLTTGGADRVLTVDLHSPQIQGFFHIPVDHLTAVGLLSDHLRMSNLEDSVIVSPDTGRVNTATEYANRLGLPVVIVHKRRMGPEETEAAYVVGDVCGKCPIIIDDMITTGATIHNAAQALLAEGAKPEIKIAVTHGVLVDKALEYLAASEIREIIVTDTIPIGHEKRLGKMTVVPIAPLIGAAINRIHKDSSVSELFA